MFLFGCPDPVQIRVKAYSGVWRVAGTQDKCAGAAQCVPRSFYRELTWNSNCEAFIWDDIRLGIFGIVLSSISVICDV